MPQLYAFQPDGHGPDSFFVIAESIEYAISRVREHIDLEGYDDYHYRGLFRVAYFHRPGQGPHHLTNGSYNLTILNPGEVIDNDNQ
jgi:hypothetical protein